MNLTSTLKHLFCCVLFLSANGAGFAFGLNSSFGTGGDLATAKKYDVLGNTAIVKGDWATAAVDYQYALKVAPDEEGAVLGLARCAANSGKYELSAKLYNHVLIHNEFNIDIITEYVLVLQKAGDVQNAIVYYNKVLKYCIDGYSVVTMQTYPQYFRTDGSDYDAREMTAVVYIIQALNASDDDPDRIGGARLQSIAAEPQSPIVQYYNGFLLQKVKEAVILRAQDEALGQSLAGAAAK